MFPKFLLVLLSLSVCSSVRVPIPCPTFWVSYNLGDPFPANAVPVQSGSSFLTRARISGHYHVGTVASSGVQSLIHAGSSRHQLSSFDVLTNPNACHLTWLPPFRNNLPAVTGVTDTNDILRHVVNGGAPGMFVARASVGGGWTAGCAYTSGGGLTYYGGSTSSYQILVSQVAGLTLDIKNFRWLSSPFDHEEMDFLGLDFIYNKSPAESVLTITHTKRVTNSYSFTNTHSTSHTAGGSVSAGFWGVSASASYSYTSENSESSTIGHEETKEVSVSRTVTVPALTSVQACSVLRTAEDFEIDYEADGRFYKEGYNSSQIKAIIGNNYEIKAEDEVSVIIHVTGTFRGALAMSNQLILLPTDANTGCDELADTIAVRRRVKASKFSTMQEKLESKQRLAQVWAAITGKTFSLNENGRVVSQANFTRTPSHDFSSVEQTNL